MKQSRIVVPFAGGVESTPALRALVAATRGEVVTLTLDLGQGDVLAQIRDAALAAGAVRAHVIDARETFARDYVLPALRRPLPEGGWAALVRTLAAPLVAAKLQEIAAIEQATAAAHALTHDVDASLAGRIVTDGIYLLTRPAAAAPDAPADVEITVTDGVPVAINDVPMPLIELFESLTLIAGQHGVGRVDGVEAPAGVVLHAALQAESSGVVRLRLFKGSCEPAAALVSH
jgi:argininosuccinate synthase